MRGCAKATGARQDKVGRPLDVKTVDRADVCVLKTKFRLKTSWRLKENSVTLGQQLVFQIVGREGIVSSSVFMLPIGGERH